MCGFAGFREIGNGVFRHHEGAARIDLMHQIEAAHVGLRNRRELDGAGIVDHDVDAAEARRGLVERGLHRGFLAHVDLQSQRPPAGFLDLGGGGVDGAFELGMRLNCLGGDGDIGAVGGGLERDRQPDAARAAGDEQGLALQRHCHSPRKIRLAFLDRKPTDITAAAQARGPQCSFPVFIISPPCPPMRPAT